MNMGNNQFGTNIQHLREIYNETLEEVKSVVDCSQSTVKGYENGSRKPNLQTLQSLAVNYNKQVDELLNTNLINLENISIDSNSPRYTTELMKMILPLYSSEDAMKNSNFKKESELWQKLLTGFSNAEVLLGNIIVRILRHMLRLLMNQRPLKL